MGRRQDDRGASRLIRETWPMAADDQGPVMVAIGDRQPFGPMQELEHDDLVAEQQVSLRSPRRKASLSARGLFAFMDLAYGKQRTRVFDRVRVNRWEQDNEQWHLLILEELLSQGYNGASHGWIKSRILPQVMAFAYYQLSWITYAIKPTWSYRLNADFEDHAEHEYAHLVEEHPEWEHVQFVSEFHSDFGHYDSLADLFRQIGYDERLHKLQSEAAMKRPRFH
jgi:hypothetical protein